ncbi:ABC transporter ATP-binding protein [Microbacterium pseudoresistens]|uniref:ABC-type quaternary amine transporter n=1 Tax=Microbacterium pseudoresistens TaxID=640634 RepID=A0A7Y9JP20_9MICO|nr:ABC transporter ATP-binding protein [Microbacterium pseudoresistens]NYD54249.1 iron(III) transport system ATP-binding protein [Microbacterium pseudoresistens]
MTNATPGDAQVEIVGLSKRFKRRSGAGDVIPIDDVTLSIAPGEFVVLLGPSGCGKTTLLRSIAGLERPDQGVIRITGKEVFNASRKLFVPPNRRPISMIFQSYALWPHMTVFQNIAYPITSRSRVGRAEVRAGVERALTQVGLSGLGSQYPGQLSGGQQQRVALARALVTDAKVLLFDEPLSNVDAKVREELRAQLIEMQREFGFTAIYVTHDQAEAMELADRIAVLNSGHIEQLAAPREVYSRPATRYVAEFVGAANLYEGSVAAVSGGTVSVDTPLGRLVVADHGVPVNVDDRVSVMFRPEDVELSTTLSDAENVRAATILRTNFVGAQQTVVLEAGDVRIQAIIDRDASAPEGAEASVRIARDDLSILPYEERAGGAA